MAVLELVKSGPITAADLLTSLQEAGRASGDWRELPAREAVLHFKGRIFPDTHIRELTWHIHEIQHVNVRRHFVLKWPILGKIIRDQHEINRLILISLEKSTDLINTVEAEFGRMFAGLRNEDRAFWIRRFRFLGRRMADARNAIRNLREGWESGRCRRHRLRSRAGQSRMNTCVENALRALAEVSSTLVEIADWDRLHTRLSADVTETETGSAACKPLAGHVESCVWHAAEGGALRKKVEQKGRLLSGVMDFQKRLNRIYMIALEENFTILQELAGRVSHLGYLAARGGNQLLK